MRQLSQCPIRVDRSLIDTTYHLHHLPFCICNIILLFRLLRICHVPKQSFLQSCHCYFSCLSNYDHRMLFNRLKLYNVIDRALLLSTVFLSEKLHEEKCDFNCIEYDNRKKCVPRHFYLFTLFGFFALGMKPTDWKLKCSTTYSNYIGSPEWMTFASRS